MECSGLESEFVFGGKEIFLFRELSSFIILVSCLLTKIFRPSCFTDQLSDQKKFKSQKSLNSLKKPARFSYFHFTVAFHLAYTSWCPFNRHSLCVRKRREWSFLSFHCVFITSDLVCWTLSWNFLFRNNLLLASLKLKAIAQWKRSKVSSIARGLVWPSEQ